MSCRCAIRFLNFYFQSCSHIRVEKWRFFSESCNLNSIYIQGIVNKWYTRMWLGRPCRCPMRFKKLHCSPGVKNRIFKNNISLTWHSLISLFCYYPSLKEDVTLHFNTFESPLHNDTLCQVWLKLAKWFLRRRFLKVVNEFSLCGYYLPLKKCMALYLNKFEFP